MLTIFVGILCFAVGWAFGADSSNDEWIKSLKKEAELAAKEAYK